MKKLMIGSLLSAAMFSAVSANAATAELKVIGTITPAACVPNFAGGSTIDYGNIAAATLNTAAQTNLPTQTTTITVACDAPTIFYLTPSDERAATVAAGVTPVGATAADPYGLGTAPNGANIGAYRVQLTGGTADTGTTARTNSTDGGATWTTWSGNFRNSGTQLISFTNGTTAQPAPHTSVTADIGVFTSIAPASRLPLTEEITLDGLATVEVVYP